MKVKMEKIKSFLKNNLFLILICSQPFLDVLAFWTKSESGTASGYIRFAVMALLCIYVLVNVKSYKRFIPAAAAVVLVFALHMVNCFRRGYLGFASDTRMILSFAYLPVLAVCFCCITDTERLRDQAVKGIVINCALETLVILISLATGTFMHTYSEGIGISGWVISDNRCCHSDILSSVCVMAGYLAVSSKKKPVNVIVPAVIFALLITNGTKVCYMTLLAVSAAFPVFLIFRSFVTKKKLDASQRLVSVVMAVLFAASVAAYPVTPRYKMEELKRATFTDHEKKFAEKMDRLGYNVYAVTLDDIFSDDVLHENFVDYYKIFVFSNVDVMGRIYSFDRIIEAYDGTVDASILGDARDMKNVYVGFIFSDSDLLTRMFGIEYDSIGEYKGNDLENDWYAIVYYLGYFGFALAVIGVLFILWRIFRLLRGGFHEALTDLNFTLLLGFAMQLGMAYFSGAIMRRPNASIYVALYIALIFYSTRRIEKEPAK